MPTEDRSVNNQQSQKPADNQQSLGKEKNSEQMTSDEFMEALAKLKHLSRRQKAGKTIGYVKVKAKRLKNNLPEDSTRLQSRFGANDDAAVDKVEGAGKTKTDQAGGSAQEDQPTELGGEEQEPSLAERVGLGQKNIDQMSKQEKQGVKGKLAEPGNMEEMMAQPGKYKEREKQEGESDQDHQKKQEEYQAAQEQGRRQQLEQALGRPLNLPQDRPMNALDATEQGAAYSNDRKKRKEQKEESEQQIKDDYSKESWASRRREGAAVGEPGKGKNLAGKAAGKAIGKAAEMAGPVSGVLIYGLALANDFPDLLNPIIEWLSIFSWSIVDFFVDVIVFLGFRYFLRDHINVPGVKVALYVCGIAEILPIPILDHIDIFPFWTLCAWLALRQIQKEKEGKQ